MRSTRRWRLIRPDTAVGADAWTCVTVISACSLRARAPSVRLTGASPGHGFQERVQHDEGRARGPEPRQQVPRSADDLVAAAIDRGRVAKQVHAGLRLPG